MERNEVERHAPQGRARTMSDEQEREDRSDAEFSYNWNQLETEQMREACNRALSELDAERAAHERTKAERDYYRDTLLSRHGGECIALLDELTALKARLALAEAVCESCGFLWDSDDYDHDALAAWRAAR